MKILELLSKMADLSQLVSFFLDHQEFVEKWMNFVINHLLRIFDFAVEASKIIQHCMDFLGFEDLGWIQDERLAMLISILETVLKSIP